jgi:hypothetical protein
MDERHWPMALVRIFPTGQHPELASDDPVGQAHSRLGLRVEREMLGLFRVRTAPYFFYLRNTVQT